MRLTSFFIENYGNFEAVGLSLDPQPGHINLIVAPNGGGKTVLRRAFRDLLFGIPGRSTMGFRFGYSGMRLLAEGLDDAGATFVFGRRKGIGNTLINADGNSLDLSILKPLIGEAGEALFERLFALDSQLLRIGAEAMLASGGDLAEALFAAGSGIAGLRRACEEFEKLRDQLAKDHKTRSLPFYKALDALAAARSDLNASTVRPKDWEELSAKLDFARRQRASLIDERAHVQAEIQRFERIKRVRPWLEQLERARQQIAASGGAPRLPADTEDRWRDARQAVGDAERERNAEKDRLESITEAIAAEQPVAELLEQSEGIDALERARDQIAADRRDLPKREADCRRAAARLGELLAALGFKSSAEIATILPNGPQVASARDLIKQHAALSERLRTANAEASKYEPEIVATEAEFAQIGELGDTAELAALVAEVRAPGDPARLVADLRAKSSQEEARFGAALAKVPLWDRGLEALAAIVPPARHMVDRSATTLDSAKTLLAEAEREVIRLLGKRNEAAQRLADARRGNPVPDAAAIDAARNRRDRGWSLIRRSKFEGEDLKAEIAAYAGSLGMTTSFERAMGDADDLADRRDEESARLAAIAEQELAISRFDDDIAGAEQRLVEAGQGHHAALRAWVTLTEPLALVEPSKSGDLREFLTAREVVLDRRADRDSARQTLAAEAERQEAARLRFAKFLPAEKCASLSGALATAQQLIDGSAQVRQKRGQLGVQLKTFHLLHQQAQDERAAANAAVAVWLTKWRDCISSLRRPPEETPAGFEKAIELIGEAHGESRTLGDLEHRIAGMRENIAGFEARVANLVTAAAPDLIGEAAELVAEELRRRMKSNRDVEARRLGLLNQKNDAQAKLVAAANQLDGAKATLDALRQEIGGGSDEEIALRIALAGRRADAESKSAEIEAKLVEIGDGWRIDALEQEIAAVAAGTVDSELARLRDDDDRIATERDGAVRDEQLLIAQLDKIKAGENAIDAEERRQAAIASVTRISSEALLYHAGSCLLRHGIERLRNVGQNGLVQRIGAAFARITGGAYAGVAADEDEKGAPFLLAIEADGKTEKRIDELSDGTRDQLFLALRLVMVEDYAHKAPVLPFIADDLLQTSDDYGRTANALAAFADLSRHVQVIVLSHHRQLVEIAKVLPRDAVNICDLTA